MEQQKWEWNDKKERSGSEEERGIKGKIGD